ncbi:MAG: hypothetical protein ACREJU_20160 [Nitrospiraceae bacterium]
MVYLVIIMMALASAPNVWAEEPMFKCEDGTFTNRIELLCQPYEPKGKVLVLPRGTSIASARALLGEPAAAGDAAQKVNLPDPANVCSLYKEWASMNLRTSGGVTFPLTQDLPRWLALSRIFTAIGAPQNCP